MLFFIMILHKPVPADETGSKNYIKRLNMSTLRMLHYFNYVMATIFVVFYFYQIGYLLLGLIRRRTKTPDTPHALHRYAAVISARNEENVIGGLIASLKAQDYPSELLDIYVIADNCTDNTAQVALAAGAAASTGI